MKRFLWLAILVLGLAAGLVLGLAFGGLVVFVALFAVLGLLIGLALQYLRVRRERRDRHAHAKGTRMEERYGPKA